MAVPLTLPSAEALLAAEVTRAVERRAALWTELRGARLFLTGATGLFGRWLVAALLEADRHYHLEIELTLLSRNPKGFAIRAPHLAAHPAVALHRGNVTDFDLPQGGLSHIIHGATTSADETFQGEPPLRKFDTLVNGTRRVLELAARDRVERLLFLSSGVVYGNPTEGMEGIPEGYAVAPDLHAVDSALGQAKRAAEFLCAAYAQVHGFDYRVARCFSFVGPLLPLDLHYGMGNFIAQALWQETIVVKGDGLPVRSYLYLGDLVTWLQTLLLTPAQQRVYNVGSDLAVSIADLAHLVRDQVAPDKPVKILGQRPYSVGNPARSRYLPDVRRAQQEFGLAAWTPLTDAIRFTAEHARLQATR